MIALLDYGGGNVGSVLKAIEYLGYKAERVDRPEPLFNAGKIMFPGQGHFGAMMKMLGAREMLGPLRQLLAEGKPYLGICLGLQALYEGSEEAPGVAGLSILPGHVRRFQGVFKVPHIGWSQLEIQNPNGLFKSVANGSFVYYCHSYYGPLTGEDSATTEYGQRFAAGVETRNIWAVQFHPEKSAEVGLQVLKNFLSS
jgi:glutamine amidotransferase/cyclase